jgi:hypothetical protein
LIPTGLAPIMTEAKAKAEGKHHVLMRVKTADATEFVALPIGNG